LRVNRLDAQAKKAIKDAVGSGVSIEF